MAHDVNHVTQFTKMNIDTSIFDNGIHRRRTHRGNGSFAPVLLKVPGQTYLYAPVLFGQYNLLAIGDRSQLSPPIFTCCSLLFGN